MFGLCIRAFYRIFGHGIGKAQVVGCRSANAAEFVAQLDAGAIIQRCKVIVNRVAKRNVLGVAAVGFGFAKQAEPDIRADTLRRNRCCGIGSITGTCRYMGLAFVENVSPKNSVRFCAFAVQLKSDTHTQVFRKIEFHLSANHKGRQHTGGWLEFTEIAERNIGEIKTGFYAETHLCRCSGNA
jgi:hypothetical protein